MPNDSVDVIVTSPPYWGLRDYGIEPVVWGGHRDHQHEWGAPGPPRHPGQVPQTKWATVDAVAVGQNAASGASCRCGAWWGDLGLEPTVELYVEHMVVIFRDLRRVLRPWGSCWLNIGDTYATRGGLPEAGSYDGGTGRGRRPRDAPNRGKRIPRGSGRWGGGGVSSPGLKEKDLVGVPWRLAFALQADGWYLRSDIIWAKPNAMPESVTDRPTKSHEYVFLLTKNARYFFDATAIAEPVTGGTHSRGPTPHEMPKTMRAPTGWDTSVGDGTGHRSLVGRYRQPRHKNNDSFTAATWGPVSERNVRSVWTIATEPYPEAHFATFPRELPRRAIAAGTSEVGHCAECGAPWERIVDKARSLDSVPANLPPIGNTSRLHPSSAQGVGHGRISTLRRTAGWGPTCRHGHEPVPALVLDPFAGSGTALAVAVELGRCALGIDIDPDDIPLMEKRIAAAELERSRLLVDGPLAAPPVSDMGPLWEVARASP